MKFMLKHLAVILELALYFTIRFGMYEKIKSSVHEWQMI